MEKNLQKNMYVCVYIYLNHCYIPVTLSINYTSIFKKVTRIL